MEREREREEECRKVQYGERVDRQRKKRRKNELLQTVKQEKIHAFKERHN